MTILGKICCCHLSLSHKSSFNTSWTTKTALHGNYIKTVPKSTLFETIEVRAKVSGDGKTNLETPVVKVNEKVILSMFVDPMPDGD